MLTQSNPIQNAYEDIVKDEEKWYASKEKVAGLQTGFPSIDEVTGGLHEGESIILAARPSEGKSSLANQIAFNVALDLFKRHKQEKEFPGVVLVFNPEMTLKQILMRQASVLSAVSTRSIQRGEATEEEREIWHEELKNLTLLAPYMRIYAGKSTTIQELGLEVDKVAASTNVVLIVIDYIQRLRVDGNFRTAYEKAGEISTSIKDIANVHNVPVLALSQLNRDAAKENGESTGRKIAHLRDSGRIEEDADVVMTLERNRTDSFQYDDSVSAIILVEKNRNGPRGRIVIQFTPRITRFDDIGQFELEL
jgi:replicative DNA helicase